MNQMIEIILKRKGTKTYSAEQIKDEDLDLILEAGIAGPTARNNQNRHFTVVQNKEKLEQIDRGTFQLMTAPAPDYKPLFQAPTFIVVSAPADYMFADQDCAIAVENMSIAATALGLGSAISFPRRGSGNEPEQKSKGYRHSRRVPCGGLPDSRLRRQSPQEPIARNRNVVNYVK
jgi:hypothetical protein